MKLCTLFLIFSLSNIFADEELSRQKRVSVEGQESFRPDNAAPANADADSGENPFPLSMPYRFNSKNATGANPEDLKAYNDNKDKWGTCLIYMEGITVVIINHALDTAGGQKAAYASMNGTTWYYSKDFVNCQINDTKTPETPANPNVTFTIQLNLKKSPPKGYSYAGQTQTEEFVMNDLSFTMTYTVPSIDNWYLDNIDLDAINIVGSGGKLQMSKDTTITEKSFNGTGSQYFSRYADIRGMYGYSYGCSSTPAVWFQTAVDKTPKGVALAVGLIFNNFQVELYNTHVNIDPSKPESGEVWFNHQVNDCVGTFSVGSWMGIIASLVMATILVFGFLMLNSVQTMDRFDDPKAKQIMINVKE